MRYDEMMAKKLHVYTSLGQQVAWVREAIECKDGVFVKTLLPAVRKDGSFEKAISNNDVIEVDSFVAGGVIR